MDEAHFEHAQRITDAAAEAAVRRAQQQASRAGQAECEDCGADIPPARRAACPSAIRCIHCQTAHERHMALQPTTL